MLVLGTMPGPVALRRRQYYGFRLLKANRIALWDVIASCRRVGASDSAITCVTPNRIPELLKKYPNIRTIFVNGKTAKRLFQMHFGEKVKLPVQALPSTSPAHASMSFPEKLRRWKILKSYSI